jgi:hypothetical protein
MLNYLKGIFAKPRAATSLQSASFSTPSISASAPRISLDVHTIDNRLVVEEDDWRFTELVSQGFSRLIDEELEDIRKIHHSHKARVGWDKVHVRRKIPEPLIPAQVLLQELADLFADRQSKTGVCYCDTAGVVDHGFAFQTRGGMKVYGQYHPTSGQDRLHCICLEPCSLDQKESLVLEVDRLAGLARKHQLYLVCWNKLQKPEPDAGRYLEFLETQFHT